MTLRSLVIAAALGIGAVACGESPDVDESTTSTIGSESPETGASEEALGTAGSEVEPAQGEETRAAEADLPGTASPLATVGIAGLLALGAAGGLRLLRR